MPRIVRRRPLIERIKSALDPWDLFLWLSEEIETRDLGSKSLGTQLGIALNFVFLVSRANGTHSADVDDVFSDDSAGSGWLAYLVSTGHHADRNKLSMVVADSPIPSPGLVRLMYAGRLLDLEFHLHIPAVTRVPVLRSRCRTARRHAVCSTSASSVCAGRRLPVTAPERIRRGERRIASPP